MSPKPRQDATDEYLTVEEFAALTSDQHHAVWAAAKRIDAIPQGSILRYHRAQVEALLGRALPGETAAAR